jgi:cytochrome c oxidase cbb3-type subunit III
MIAGAAIAWLACVQGPQHAAGADKSAAPPLDIPEWVRRSYPVRKTDPAAVERGRVMYSANGCSFCHGKDARGGDGGGPSLLRSQRVLKDQKGELIAEVVLTGVPNTAMAAFPLTQEQVADIAEFLHSFDVIGSDPTRMAPLSTVTGNAKAGKRYAAQHCSGCHKESEFHGLLARYGDARDMQQAWLMPSTRKRSRIESMLSPTDVPLTADVTLASGERRHGKVIKIDEFLITLGLPDGSQRTLARQGDEPKVELHDPLEGHKALLPVYTDADIHDVTAYLVTLK